MKIPCWHCGLYIESLDDDVPRCRKCNKPLCWPAIRDCWDAHDKAKHQPRKVKDIQGPGLDRLTPKESESYREGVWT